ncbi:uncharacterized protein LOC136028224 isoform X2 [Artemia franciscana]|uniref:uncharacterized protein LOC136028224 isoform X2 n=1 Tax=Artemia franciscana TaxID=6661 RepID=UPI0032DA9D32
MIMSSLTNRQQARQLACKERKRALQQRDSDSEEPLPSFPPIKKSSALVATAVKKRSFQQQSSLKTSKKPSFSISPGFQTPTNTHQVRELQGETFSRKLDKILKDMSVPSPIGQLTPTPERSELKPYQEEASRNLIEDKPTVSNTKVEIDLSHTRGHGLPIRPPVSIDRPSRHESRREAPHQKRSLEIDMLPSRPLSPIDIFQIVNQFKTHKPLSPLGSPDSKGSETKMPFANEPPTIGPPTANLDPSNNSKSRSQTLKNVKTRKMNMVHPLSGNEWTMDRNKIRSIRHVFQNKGKPTSKQEIEQANEKENHDVGKSTDGYHEQCVQTKGNENVPTQVPVVKCSLNLLLIRRLPTIQKTAIDKDVNQVVKDCERPLFDQNTNRSDCAKSWARDLNADTEMNENGGEFSIHRKEEKRKRVNSNNSVDERNSLYLPSQSITHSNSSVHNGLETDYERSENELPYLDVDIDQATGRSQSGATVESGYQSLRVVASDQEEFQNLQHSPRFFLSNYERIRMETGAKPDERNHNDCLNEAKRLKNIAVREHDIVFQYIFYLKAAMFFVLAGASMDSDGKQPNKGSQNMYSEANTLIKHTSRKFQPRDYSSPHREILTVLLILSMKAQAILQLKLYKSKHSEIKEHARILNEYFKKKMVPLPSVEVPTGCVNSISSNSSPSGSLPSSGGFLPESQNKDSIHSSQMVMVPASIHTTLMRNHYNVGLLQASLDLWDQAHQMALRTFSEDFFIRIDNKFGSLTLHSSLRELVRIVNDILETLGNDYRDFTQSI